MKSGIHTMPQWLKERGKNGDILFFVVTFFVI